MPSDDQLLTRFDALLSSIAQLEQRVTAASRPASAAATGGRRRQNAPAPATLAASASSSSGDAPVEVLELAAPCEPDATRVAAAKSPNEARQLLLSAQRGISSSRYIWAPTDYYSWTLEQRRAFLEAPSIHHLCKTVIMTNTRYDQQTPEQQALSSQHYAIVVQYSAKVHRGKVTKAIRELCQANAGAGAPIPPTKTFNLRLASEEDNARLSGFSHNAVTLLGMKVPLPVVIAEPITRLSTGVCYLGGGDVDLKWAVNVAQLVAAFDAKVADISQPDPDAA